MAVFIFVLYVLQFFTYDEVLGAHMQMRQIPILCTVSLVSQTLCGQYLNDFYIFLAGK